MTFRSSHVETLDISGTAVDVPFEDVAPLVKDLSGNAPNGNKGIRQFSHLRVLNTHSSQNLYLRFNATATTAEGGHEAEIAPGGAVVIAVPVDLRRISMIGGGANTTGNIAFGTVV